MAKSKSSEKSPKSERMLTLVLALATVVVCVIGIRGSKDSTASETVEASEETIEQQEQVYTGSELIIYEEGTTINIKNEELMDKALRHLKERTGIEFVVDVRATEMLSSSEGLQYYYQHFSDEDHVMIFIYPNWGQPTAYFIYGDNVPAVISKDDLIWFIKSTGYSLNGEDWLDAAETYC